jgi:hypothetical protein
MNKRLIRLTESDLHRIVRESTNRVIKETMVNSLNDIIMVASFPMDTYDKHILDKLGDEKLREITNQDERCGIWDIYEFEDEINNNNIDTDNNWIKVIR